MTLPPSPVPAGPLDIIRSRRRHSDLHNPATPVTPPPRPQRATSETALVRYHQTSSSSSRNQSPSPGRRGYSPRILHANTRNFSPSFLGLRPDNIWIRLTTTFEAVPEDVPSSPVTPTRMFAATSAQVQAGPDLEELQTEAIGFLSIAGETRLRLLPTAWPAHALPSPTSSLLSIASRQGLLAAAGPDLLVIGSTAAVRSAFTQEGPSENNVKNFSPQLKLPIPRVSQVAFSADESTLTISADEGGGLAVYDVQSMKQGNTEPAFQISTNGISVRCLVPNPSEDNAHVVALVLAKGQLMLANLRDRQLVSNANGPVMMEGVSSVAWSPKGRQLVAGLANGTAVQMTPEGAIKAEIPRPPQLDGDQHVSGISWLQNDIFLFIYAPSNFELDHAPDSTFIIATRQPKTTNYAFQKLADPCPPFGMNRSPPYHFLQRLREFPPALADTIFLASTASGDIGLITSSQKPLSGDAAAIQAASANLFMTTGLGVDSRRAQLPVNDEMSDTSPIGMSFDLSSTEKVKRPIPGEEIDESLTPLPNLMVLNNEGVLSSWWFVYSDAVRQGIPFPGLAALPSQQQGQQQQSQAAKPSGLIGLGGSKPSGFGAPSTFGAPSALGPKPSPWGSNASASTGSAMTGGAVFGKPAFGAPAFGQSSFGSPAQTSTPAGTPTDKPVFGSATSLGSTGGFGAVGQLGKSASPWATNNAQPTSTPAGSGFSQFAGSASNASPFGGLAASNSSQISGFGTLGQASSTGFGSGAASQPPQSVLWGSGATPASSAAIKPWGFQSDTTPNIVTSVQQEKDDDLMTDGTPNMSAPSSANPQAQGLFGNASGSPLKHSFVAAPESKPATPKPTSPLKQSSAAAVPEGKPATPKATPKSDGDNFMGSSFSDALTLTEKTDGPTTPIKKEPVETPRLEEPSTTPASAPPQAINSNVRTKIGLYDAGSESQKPPLPPVATGIEKNAPKTSATPSASPKPSAAPQSPEPKAPTESSEQAPIPPSPKSDYSPAGSPPIDLGAPGHSPFSSGPSSTSSDGPIDDAPLPPDFLSQPASAVDIPLPVTPIDVSQPVTPINALGISGPRDFSRLPRPATTKTKASVENSAAPAWSFPKSSAPAESSPLKVTSDAQSPQVPASVTKPPSILQPSISVTNTPRSPSPVRISRLAGKDIPGLPIPARGASQQFSSTPASTPLLKPTAQIAVPPTSPLRRQISFPTAPKEPEPDASYLSDDEDERIRAELAEPIEPTKRLEPFIAHQDYAGRVSGQGIPAQIEKVYRDINSMIDTLGLNARSLGAFIKGHSAMFQDGGREKKHLEKEDAWSLIEIEDLAIVQNDILTHLDAERPQGVKQKVTELQALQKELIALRTRNHSIQTNLRARSGAEDKTSSRTPSPLTPEQSAVLGDLRKQFSSLQANLVKAEDAASLLAAKLAAQEAGAGANSGRAAPTVEAVIATISKMTRMAEQKRGDLDVIEHQMRRLRFKAGPLHFEDLDVGLGALSLGGADGSPFATPPSSRKTKPPGTYALSYDYETPNASPSPTRDRGFRSSLTASARARARQEDLRARVTEEDVEAFKERRERRKKVFQVLREKVAERDGAEQQES